LIWERAREDRELGDLESDEGEKSDKAKSSADI